MAKDRAKREFALARCFLGSGGARRSGVEAVETVLDKQVKRKLKAQISVEMSYICWGEEKHCSITVLRGGARIR